MKKLVSLLLVAVLLFPTLAFAACQDNTTQLDAPANVAVSDSGLVTWDAVDNATGYVVYLNGQAQTEIADTSYQIVATNAEISVYVVAVADGYTDSKASATVVYSTVVEITPTSVAIAGSSEVRAGQTVQLTAKVADEADQTVVWSVEEGAEYVTIDDDGVVSAKSDVKGDKIVVVRATSVANGATTTKSLNVLARTQLTADMLAKFANVDTIGFDGFLTIDYYTYGTPRRHKGTTTLPVHTALDGTHWYAQYTDNSAGLTGELFYSKYDDPDDGKSYAYQDELNFLNQVEQTPLVDSRGERSTWEKSGYYNNLKNLKVSDFVFDENEWRWTYCGKNPYEMTTRIVSSADPYAFAVDANQPFSLLIDEGEILGLYVKSGDDHSVSSQYIAVQKLFVAINTDSSVEVKSIKKFAEQPFQAELNQAIENMRNLKAYTLDFRYDTMMNTSSAVKTGFYEIINPTDCFFRDYTTGTDSNGNTILNFDNEAVYGFRKISDNLYNTYSYATDTIYDVDPDKFDTMDTKTRTLRCDRAFNGSFDKAKPTFAFSGALFTQYQVNRVYDPNTGVEHVSTDYYVDRELCYMASTLYCGIGNDIALYGMFASDGIFEGQMAPTCLTVETVNGKPYITQASFFYYLGSLYGTIVISYDNFVAADQPLTEATTVPAEQEERLAAMAQRVIPASWAEVNIITKATNDSGKEYDRPIRLAQYLEEQLFVNEANPIAAVPFFGVDTCLGDTFGFATAMLRQRGGENYTMPCVSLYYDVALDSNYTIDSSLAKIKSLLTKNGFVTNTYGEYVKGNVIISVTDDGLDLIIYVWNKTILKTEQLGK